MMKPPPPTGAAPSGGWVKKPAPPSGPPPPLPAKPPAPSDEPAVIKLPPLTSAPAVAYVHKADGIKAPPFHKLNHRLYSKEAFESSSFDANTKIGQLKQQFVEALQSYSEAEDNVLGSGKNLWMLVSELFWANITWDYEVNVGKFLSSFTWSDASTRLAIDILDQICYFIHCGSGTNKTLWLSKYRALVTSVRTVFNESQMQEIMFHAGDKDKQIGSSTGSDFKLPEEVALLGFPNQQKYPLKKRMIKIRSSTWWAQDKYNLLIENSEGFAKLITEFSEHVQQCKAGRAPKGSAGARFQTRIMQIIGHFKLDPNRVLDLTLDALQQIPEDQVLLKFLSSYNRDTIGAMLGFKFRHHAEEIKESDFRAYDNLFMLAAILINRNIVHMDTLLPHLYPERSKLFRIRDKFVAGEASRAGNLGKQRLTEDRYDREDREKDEKLKQKKLKSKQQLITDYNQWLDLLEATIKIGDWANATTLFTILKPACPESRKSVHTALCGMVRSLLEPLHHKYFEKTWCCLNAAADTKFDADKPVPVLIDDIRELPYKISPFIEKLHLYLYKDVGLFCMICRLLKVSYKAQIKDPLDYQGNDDDAKFRFDKKQPKFLAKLEQLIRHLLGAFSLMSHSPAVADTFYSTIKVFPYQIRYRIYGYWNTKVYDSYPELLVKKAEVEKTVKYYAKRFHAADAEERQNDKKTSRQMSRMIDHNPTLGLKFVLKILQQRGYNLNIKVFVEGFRYLSRMAKDIFVWELLRQIEVPQKIGTTFVHRPLIEIGNGSYAFWFQSLTEVLGQFAAKFTDTDMSPVTQFVVNKLKNNDSRAIALIGRLITRVSGIEPFGADITNEQVDALSGRTLLRALSLFREEYLKIRDSKLKEQVRPLLTCILDHNMLLPIFVLLGQQKHWLSIKPLADIPMQGGVDVKAEMIDRCQDLFTQFIVFLQTHMPALISKYGRYNLSYQNSIPPLLDLVRDFHLRPEMAFPIIRPVLHLHRIIAPDGSGGAGQGTATLTADMQQKLEATCRMLEPEAVWTNLTPKFYAAFWRYALKDVMCPKAQYEKHIDQLKQDQYKLGRKIDFNETKSDERKRKKQEQAYKKKRLELTAELENHQRHVQKGVHVELKTHAATWLTGITKNKADIAKQILYTCVFPRLTCSDLDAKYSAVFIRLMTNLKVPGFSLMEFMHQIMVAFPQLLASCTYSEARRFGRFFSELLRGFERYRDGKKRFEFNQRVNSIFTFQQGTYKGVISHEDYQTIFRYWHKYITIYIVRAMTSKNPLFQKCAIIFLYQVLQSEVFPRIKSHCEHLRKNIKEVNKDIEAASILKPLIVTTIGNLKNRTEECVDEQMFGGRGDLKEEETTRYTILPKGIKPKAEIPAVAAKPKQVVSVSIQDEEKVQPVVLKGEKAPVKSISVDVSKIKEKASKMQAADGKTKKSDELEQLMRTRQEKKLREMLLLNMKSKKSPTPTSAAPESDPPAITESPDVEVVDVTSPLSSPDHSPAKKKRRTSEVIDITGTSSSSKKKKKDKKRRAVDALEEPAKKKRKKDKDGKKR